MLYTIVTGCLVILLLRRLLSNKKIDVSHIPGPSESPWWMLLDPPDVSKSHLFFQQMGEKYGPVARLSLLTGENVVILSGYEPIYQATVTDGKVFAGRPTTFRVDVILDRTGILASYDPDETWKTLRKTTQKHLRQFGDGVSRLEAIIIEIAEDMFSDFDNHVGKPYDPRQVIFDTALNSIAFLMIGHRTKSGDPVVEMMRRYEHLILKIIPIDAALHLRILDAFPWLRFFKWPGWKLFGDTLKLEADIWKTATKYSEENPEAESICQVLKEHVAQGEANMTEKDCVKSLLSLLLAGVTTTSNSFYATINLLAHNKHVQETIFKEAQKCKEENGRDVMLQDRPHLPYTRATILEMLRYVSVVANGLIHRNLKDAELAGYKIPADSIILISIWSLHHDESFWEDPYSFRPERFLDENGDVIPADHPKRKHLMPFGAGPRVCLGESLSLTRLFLWIVTLVQRFEITPAEGNEKSSTDARGFKFSGVLKPTPYNVIFNKRN